MTTANDIFGIVSDDGNETNPDLTVSSVHFEMKQYGRNGYTGTVTVTRSDNSVKQFNKMYRNKLLGQVRSELRWLKADLIKRGVLESNIIINWSK